MDPLAKGETKQTLGKDNSKTYGSTTPVAKCQVTLQEGRGKVTFTVVKNGTDTTRGPITLSRESTGISGDEDSQVKKIVLEGTGGGDNKFTLNTTV